VGLGGIDSRAGGKLLCKFVAVRHVVGILMLMGYGGFMAVEFTILREE
jgi:hypothetical protein